MIHALFAAWEVPRLTTVAAVTLVLTATNMEMEPCNIVRINSIRSAVYFGACICAVCSIGATFTAEDNYTPLFILLTSWGAILILLVLAQMGFVHSFIKKKNYELLEAMNNEKSINE